MISDLILQLDLQDLADAGKYDEVAEALNAKTIDVRDNKSWTLSELGSECGVRLGSVMQGYLARRLVSDSLQGAIEAKVTGYSELIMAQHALATKGLDLSPPDVQTTLDQLGETWPEAILDVVKSLGVSTISPATQAGIEATEITVKEGWEDYRFQQKLTNAIALARSTMSSELSDEDATSVWNDAWIKVRG